MERSQVSQTSIMMDNRRRYGLISRVLHWAMAYLLLWQLCIVLAWRFLGKSPVLETISGLGPSHGTVGVLTLVFVLVRSGWALSNSRRRPAAEGGLAGHAARFVHITMYVLLFLVPALALIRAYGSGKGYEQWGFQLIAATGREVEWMMLPANLLHSPLAWFLAVLIAGHIAAALIHGVILRNHVLARMTGSFGRAAGMQ